MLIRIVDLFSQMFRIFRRRPPAHVGDEGAYISSLIEPFGFIDDSRRKPFKIERQDWRRLAAGTWDRDRAAVADAATADICYLDRKPISGRIRCIAFLAQ
ncbi:hypothetical protein ATY79_11825 [Rhizobium sp. R693]|nr:hypothetical protein ATY79_11825 [Rhizobium sp. R693]